MLMGPKQVDLRPKAWVLSFTAAVDQGIAGLVGAAVGGLIGIVGMLGAARLTGKDQRRTQHEHWRRQLRRDAFSQLVSQATEALRLGDSAIDAFEARVPSSARLSEQFGEVVERLDAAGSLIALEGPEEAANEAGEVITELHSWANALDIAIAVREGRHTFPSELWSVPSLEELVEDRERSHEAVAAFTANCRSLLDC